MSIWLLSQTLWVASVLFVDIYTYNIPWCRCSEQTVAVQSIWARSRLLSLLWEEGEKKVGTW